MTFYEKFKIVKTVTALQEVTKTEDGYTSAYLEDTPQTEFINVVSREGSRTAIIDMQETLLTDEQVIERIETEFEGALDATVFIEKLMFEGIDL